VYFSTYVVPEPLVVHAATAKDIIEPGNIAAAKDIIEPGNIAAAKDIIEPGNIAAAKDIIEPGNIAAIEPGNIAAAKEDTVPNPLLLQLQETRLEVDSVKAENAQLRREVKSLKRCLVMVSTESGSAVTRSQTRCSRVRLK
jgi:hypothetical protein